MAYRRKSRRSNRKSRRISRIPQGAFPTLRIAKLKYCEQITMNPGIGSWASYLFRANSCFDPNATGTGHQPMGFDQWSALYTHYTVLASKITVRFGYNGAVDQSPMIILCRLQRDATLFNVETLGEIMETARTSNTSYANYYATGALSRPLRRSFNAKRYFNVGDVRDNSELKATTGSNPQEGAFYNIGCRSLATAYDGSVMDVIVTVEYTVSFSEPIVQLQS